MIDYIAVIGVAVVLVVVSILAICPWSRGHNLRESRVSDDGGLNRSEFAQSEIPLSFSTSFEGPPSKQNSLPPSFINPAIKSQFDTVGRDSVGSVATAAANFLETPKENHFVNELSRPQDKEMPPGKRVVSFLRL